MKKLLAAAIITLSSLDSHAAELIVSAVVARSGVLSAPDTITSPDAEDFSAGRVCWLIHAEVTNQSSEPQEVAYMSCSWYESLRITPDAEFAIHIWSCAKNVPKISRLNPGGKVTFEFAVVARNPAAAVSGDTIRVGYAWRRRMDEERTPAGESVTPVPIETFWSSDVVLPRLADSLIHPWGCVEEEGEGQPAARDNAAQRPS